jgi:hypothetical protein
MEYCVNDLPKYSPWPARLLGLEKWEQKIKTPTEITREYEYEKWGPLLEKVEKVNTPLSVEDVDELVFRDNPNLVCSVGDHLTLLNYREAHKKYLDLLEKILKKYLPASALIELGAGYGSVIIPLARRKKFCNLPIYAGEYTASGTKLIGILSQREKKQILTGHCDFNLPNFLDFEIPHEGIIFTSFSAHYLPTMTPDFIESFLSLKPKIIINIEPCYDHFSSNTLMDLMRRKYIEVNDYNRNFVTLLKKFEKDGKIEILEETPELFGTNPLLPASVIVWRGQR